MLEESNDQRPETGYNLTPNGRYMSHNAAGVSSTWDGADNCFPGTDTNAAAAMHCLSGSKLSTEACNVPLVSGVRGTVIPTPAAFDSGKRETCSQSEEHSGLMISKATTSEQIKEMTSVQDRVPKWDSIMQGDKTVFKRRILNADKEAIRSVAVKITRDERMELEDLADFAENFTRQRAKFDVTQADVAKAIGLLNGINFCQTTISRFKTMNLSLRNMRKLRPLLEDWLVYAETVAANGESIKELPRALSANLLNQRGSVTSGPSSSTAANSSTPINDLCSGTSGQSLRKRRSRTNYDATQRDTLEAFFNHTPYPNKETLAQLAVAVKLNPYIVKTWFCNRRQKVRREREFTYYEP